MKIDARREDKATSGAPSGTDCAIGERSPLSVDPTSKMAPCPMLPLVYNVLRLDEIAEYWSREIGGVRTTTEIYNELLSAFWHNRLTIFGSSGEARVDRRGLLRSVRLKSEHPGFAVLASVKMIPPAMKKHPDGGATVNLMKYIILPSDEADWSDDILEAAYRILVKMSFDDYHGVLIPGLLALSTTQEALGLYCDMKGYARPMFWFRAAKKPGSFGGRPSVMRQIAAEMTRRAGQGVLAPKLREEVGALLIWAKGKIDEKIQLPQQRSAENALRQLYKELRSNTVVCQHET